MRTINHSAAKNQGSRVRAGREKVDHLPSVLDFGLGRPENLFDDLDLARMDGHHPREAFTPAGFGI